MPKPGTIFWIFVVIIIGGLPAANADEASSTNHQFAHHHADEQEFLAQAGPEWSSAGPSRWQTTAADGSVIRLGFGLAALWQDLAEVLEQRDQAHRQLDGLKESGRTAFELRRNLLTLEAEIDFLERQLATELAPATTSGTACSGPYSLSAEADAGASWGLGSAEAKFTAPGPFSSYTKELFASVVVSSNRGSDSDWDSTTFVGGCCYQVNASASVLGGIWCSVSSHAYFQVSNGCTAYRSLWRSAACDGFDP